MKNHKIASGLIWIILMIILPLPLVLILNTGLVDSTSNLIAYDFGIFAYVWWLADVYLATRPKWIANSIGLPSMYFIHGMLAVFAIIAATIHRFTASSYHAIIRNTGNIAWYLEIVLMILAIVFLSGWLSDRLTWVRKFKANLGLKYQVSIWIHRLNFVVITLIWLHVNVIPRIANVPYFTIVFDIYTVIFLAFYFYKKFITDADMKNSGEVIVNEPLTSNIQKLSLKLNKNAKTYKAGDFYFISFREKGKSAEAHPFSVASKPQKDRLDFIIHKVGDFTKNIGQYEIGTQVHLEGPYGLFDQEVQEANGPVILYALGTGIAPLLSLAQEYTGKKDIHLIWSTSSQEEYFTDELKDLENKGLTVDKKQHRYSDSELKQIISKKELNDGNFFIVGSAPIVIKVKKTLHNLGINKNRIHDEHLTM